MKLQAIIHPAEKGKFWAEIPTFAGCVSEGETLGESPIKHQRSSRRLVGRSRNANHQRGSNSNCRN